MGTWGTRIFDDDGAADINAEYRILLGYRMDPDKAWQLIYDYFYPDYKGSDDEDVFWLSVALYQWQNGILREDVKQRALQCIDDESYLEVWKESDSATYKKRKDVLGQLKENLLHVVNPPRSVPKCPLFYRKKTKFSIGDVFSYTHENGNISYIEVVRIKKKPVTKLAPELDFASQSEFALYDVWSSASRSIEELLRFPYRRLCEKRYRKGSTVYADIYDLIYFYEELFVSDRMQFLGNTRSRKTNETAFFRAGQLDKNYSQTIEDTFALPVNISYQLLNSALSLFLQDATINIFESRIAQAHQEWPTEICKTVMQIIIKQVQSFITNVHGNHAIKVDIEERDKRCLEFIFPWVDEENAIRLRELFIPRDENSTMTELGEAIWKYDF